jgi:hypothetical protein
MASLRATLTPWAEAHGMAYVVFDRDADHGENEAIITGFPEGTRVASVWVTEHCDGWSHAGAIVFHTTSVQLFNRGTASRVRFVLRASPGEHWPCAAQIIYG